MLSQTITLLIGLAGGYFSEKIFSHSMDSILGKIKVRSNRNKAAKSSEALVEELNIQTLAHFIPPIKSVNDELMKVSISNEQFFLSPPDDILSLLPNKKEFKTEDSLPHAFEQAMDIYDISEDLVLEAKKEVVETFLNKTDGNYFNGLKFGVRKHDFFDRTINHEKVICTYQLYLTDYYTHTVMEKIRSKVPVLQETISPDDLNQTLSIFRTSIGVSIVVLFPDTDEILLTKRSKNASYTEGQELWYVSATEAISQTDYDEQSDSVDFFQAIYRGIDEELGIRQKDVAEMTINEAFFENNFFQDNLTVTVYLKEEITFEQIKKRSAKDRTLEVNDMVTIPADEKSINHWLQEHAEQCQYQTIYTLEKFIESQRY